MPDIRITFQPSLEKLAGKFGNIKVQSFLQAKIKELAFLVEREAKQVTPVDTGRLRASVRVLPIVRPLEAIIQPHTEYACVFGANTNVVMKDGIKTIGMIKKGDYVLAQDGEYHKVLNTSRISVFEKPNLVDLKVEYRKERSHKLTLTSDHRVLSKINGSVCWVEAGKLKKGNIVFKRIKTPHNKGTGKKYEIKTCGFCEKEYLGQGVKYCSIECRNNQYRIDHPQIGTKRSEDARKRISIANIKKLREHPERHPNRILSRLGFQTKNEKLIQCWLNRLAINYIKQKKIGKYFIDFYCKKQKLVFEADGAYWHQDQVKDIKRDKAIIKILGKSWNIIHIHFVDKRFSGDINVRPFNNSFYIQINPGMESYVNLKEFEEAKVLSVKRWTYKKKSAPIPKLYDLSVNKVHSFVASGIIISNCYVHEGTRYMRARPFMYWGAQSAVDGFEDRLSKDLESHIQSEIK